MQNALDTEKMHSLLQFTVEDDFSYFCNHDELVGVVAVPNTFLPSIEESCFSTRAQVFDISND